MISVQQMVGLKPRSMQKKITEKALHYSIGIHHQHQATLDWTILCLLKQVSHLPDGPCRHKLYKQCRHLPVLTQFYMLHVSLQYLPMRNNILIESLLIVPPDQKLNLQMRAQQLLSLMQSMALQASSGTLGRPNSQPSQQFMGPSLLPMQMQMPMMGSAVPAFPPFPNFFGMPAGFPNSMPFMSNIAPTTQPYQTFTAPSAVGQPTLFQQAGLSAPGATAQIPGSRRDFQRQRRESQ